MSYKQNKFLKIVKEFDVNGNDYIINGIDTNKAVFFWRTNQYEFDVIPLGSYSIVVEGANTILRISDTATLSEKERIQICYDFASISSEYEVDFNVDINVLKDNYNKAVKDIKNIYDYVKVNMMLSDATDVSIVLPKLDIDEVWVRTEEGYRGLNIGSIETIVADSVIELTNLTNDSKTELVVEGDTQTTRVRNEASSIDNSLDRMWKMYSIVTGTNRYLAGNNLASRDILMLERETNGGNLATRVGEPAKVYYGGDLSLRTQ